MGATTVDGVRDVLVETLGIRDRRGEVTESTRLLDSMPELDSMAILEIATALEDRFGIVLEDDDITGDVFETVGSLAAFVQSKLS